MKASRPAEELQEKNVPAGTPAAYIKLVQTPPVVDGKVDNVYKENGKPLEFRFLNKKKTGLKYPTRAYAVCDTDSIYICVYCEKDPDKIIAEKIERDSGVWQDDSIELFIDPWNTRTQTYFHIALNAKGTVDDSYEMDLPSWDGAFDVKCRIDPGKGWTAEIRIPFSELFIETGRVNPVWTVNITRITYSFENKRNYEESAWSSTMANSSHLPEKFGYFVIETGKH
jgi:hypothetical protein